MFWERGLNPDSLLRTLPGSFYFLIYMESEKRGCGRYGIGLIDSINHFKPSGATTGLEMVQSVQGHTGLTHPF